MPFINTALLELKQKKSLHKFHASTGEERVVNGGVGFAMKERQRWQPEEDALLRAYVKQYGPRDWNLIGQRTGKPLLRDPKSCLERWKNYLKPGLKKGSLSPEEQSLVISLQQKYGNKWKKIAAEVPGRTAKRLGKWWEVFKEKQLKQEQLQQSKKPLPEGTIPTVAGANSPAEKAVQGPYDHILETFAEKYVQALSSSTTTSSAVAIIPDPDPILSLAAPNSVVLPPWMSAGGGGSNTTSSSSCGSATPSPSVSLSLSPTVCAEPAESSRLVVSAAARQALAQHCREVEESRLSWAGHRKEAAWRLSRLEQQLEAEKARKRREKVDEFEAEIRRLRDEAAAFLGGIEAECRERIGSLRREAEAKEAKLIDTLCAKQAKLATLAEKFGSGS